MKLKLYAFERNQNTAMYVQSIQVDDGFCFYSCFHRFKKTLNHSNIFAPLQFKRRTFTQKPSLPFNKRVTRIKTHMCDGKSFDRKSRSKIELKFRNVDSKGADLRKIGNCSKIQFATNFCCYYLANHCFFLQSPYFLCNYCNILLLSCDFPLDVEFQHQKPSACHAANRLQMICYSLARKMFWILLTINSNKILLLSKIPFRLIWIFDCRSIDGNWIFISVQIPKSN